MQTIRSFVDLPRVNNQFDWKVHVMITLPSQNPAKWKDFIAYTRKDAPGMTAHNYVPRTSLNIQIREFGTMAGTSFRDRWISMDPKNVYRFKETLQKMYLEFQTKDLYFYDNGVLKLNPEISNNAVETVPVGDKTLKMSYATIKDLEHGTGDFEGIVIFVNHFRVYMTLTYLELGFMIDELCKLNLTQMGVDMIRVAMK